MKTDWEIRQELKKRNPVFRKLDEALEVIQNRLSEFPEELIAPVKQNIYEAMLVLIDQHRKEHPEI